MALTEAVNVTEKTTHINNYQLAAAAKIFKGALVINDAGFLKPASAIAGSVFQGVADDSEDNTAGGDGDLNVNVRVQGRFRLTGLSGFAQTDLKKLVYASDDETVSTSQGGDEVLVGRITEVESASIIWVEIITNPDQ